MTRRNGIVYNAQKFVLDFLVYLNRYEKFGARDTAVEELLIERAEHAFALSKNTLIRWQ